MPQNKKCPVSGQCGGCQYSGVAYTEQLAQKQKNLEKLLGKFGRVEPVLGMEEPRFYRNKVHRVLNGTRDGKILCGTYAPDSHRLIPVHECMLEDRECQAVIDTLCALLKQFKIVPYDERTGRGLLRHILVRRGFATGQLMVVLVSAQPVLPGSNTLIKILCKAHPNIATVALNINNRFTSMVLGEKTRILYGPGYITDTLCGLSFRISPASFFQVNPAQTEVLYKTALDFAALTGKETVLDAYCGTGTIGLTAAPKAGKVEGVELNKAAVRDAQNNAKLNGVKNISFICEDAGRYMLRRAAEGIHPDVVIMDPPRTGSDEAFLGNCVQAAPKRIVYVSCGPDTLARDMGYLTAHGYKVQKIQPVDMFPFTKHCEVVVSLLREK